MKQLLMATLVLCSLCGSRSAFAQSSDGIRVESGEDAAKVIETREQFRFKDFSKGKVYFRNGNTSTGMLNYNLLYDAVMFIDKKGDTLALANPVTLQYVEIESSHFYYDNGYFEIIAEYPTVKLAYKQVLKLSNREKTGGYGQKTNTSAIDNYSSIQANNQSFSLSPDENAVFTKKETFYFIDQNNRFFPSSKRNIMKAFPKKHKKNIINFINDQRTDFQSSDDLKKLLQFCSALI